eukprot:2864487-Amphidinium_carterae.1
MGVVRISSSCCARLGVLLVRVGSCAEVAWAEVEGSEGKMPTLPTECLKHLSRYARPATRLSELEALSAACRLWAVATTGQELSPTKWLRPNWHKSMDIRKKLISCSSLRVLV